MCDLYLSGLELEVEVTRRLCRLLDTPRAEAVQSLLNAGNYRGYMDLVPDYTIGNVSDFADDYLLVSLLRKSTNIPLKGERSPAEIAKQKFYSAEKLCAEANARLSKTTYLPYLKVEQGLFAGTMPKVVWYERLAELPSWVDDARQIISDILGPLHGEIDDPNGESFRPLDRIVELAKHGPGATTGVTGDGNVPSLKYDRPIDLTRELVPYQKAIMGETWAEYKSQSTPRVVPGNQFFSVPKNAEEERGACKGPTLNVFGQLGIGRYMTSRLRLSGCDLLQGHERQRYLASVAHVRGGSTIDWSQASDLWCYMAVLTLLPSDWFELLDLFRESETLIDGKWVELEKFSAMGNGYTFPLESLLFLGVMRAIVPRERWDECGVFGDDCICPREYAPEVVQALQHLGCKVNERKTFLAGRFFESCGTDWFDGQNVRPFFLRQEQDADIPYPLQIANMVRLYANRRNAGFGCDYRFKELWEWLVSLIPPPWNECYVPPQFGDTGIIVDRSEARPNKAQCESLAMMKIVGKNKRPAARGAFTDTEIDLARIARKTTGFNGWVEGFSCKHVVMSAVNVDRKTFGVLLAGLAGGDLAQVSSEMPELMFPDLRPFRAFVSREVGKLRKSARQLTVEAAPSRGLEPRRGYLGRITTKWSICSEWTDRLDWV